MSASFVSGRGGRQSQRGAPFMPVNGVTRFEPRSFAGMSGPAAPARAEMQSGGPSFNSQAQKFRGSFSISGTTKDAAGAALAACAVELFQTGSDLLLGRTISDGSGLYSFLIGFNSGNFYVVAYKAGAPDVAGTTINTLTAA